MAAAYFMIYAVFMIIQIANNANTTFVAQKEK